MTLDTTPSQAFPHGVRLADEATVRVLEAVRGHGCDSRSEVIDFTGLPRATVHQRIVDLVDSGLLQQPSLGPSRGGRPPRRLEFNVALGHILCAVFGSEAVDVAVVDLGGNIRTHRTVPADVAAGPEPALAQLRELFHEIRAELDVDAPVFGLGVGLPGPVEFKSGRPVAPRVMPGWHNYPVRDALASEFGVPVWVDNDVNLMALGEWKWGIARGHHDVIFCKVGVTGIGAGLIAGDALIRGAQGAAGDMGHVQVVDDPEVICRCGNTGCLEALASGQVMVTRAEEALREGRTPELAELIDDGGVTLPAISAAAAHGDVTCVEILHRAGRLIGASLTILVDAFNPSLVVLGGAGSASDVLLAAAREVIYARAQPLASRDLEISLSALGQAAGIHGAGTLVLNALFSRKHLYETLARARGRPVRVA